MQQAPRKAQQGHLQVEASLPEIARLAAGFAAGVQPVLSEREKKRLLMFKRANGASVRHVFRWFQSKGL